MTKSYKKEFLEKEVQELQINKAGEILYSDDTFFKVSLNEPISTLHIFFENFKDLLDSFPDRVTFPCINFQVNGTEKIIDIVVSKKEENYCVFLFDLTEHYQESHPIVQAKNEATIKQYQLQFEKQLAEAKEAFKNSFLENLNHEIRNPLNKMLVFLEELKEAKLSYENDQALKVVHKNGLHIKALMEDLLDISKIEQGTIQAKEVNFNLSLLTSNLKKQYTEKDAASGESRLQVSIEKSVPRKLVGDPRRLNQILFNLLDYAFAQDEKNEISLHINLEKTHKKTIYTHFSITFSTTNNTEINTSKAFNDYHQLSLDKATPLGNNLGLKIVKELALLLGGNATLEVLDPTTHNFIITLPFQKQKEEKSKITNLKGTGVFFSKNVLAFEDELENQYLFMKMFLNNEKGYALDFATTIEELKNFKAKKTYQVVLINESKIGLLEEIKTLFDNQDLKTVFFITANEETDAIKELIDHPKIHLLKKPFSKKELFSNIGFALLN